MLLGKRLIFDILISFIVYMHKNNNLFLMLDIIDTDDWKQVDMYYGNGLKQS